MSDYEIVAVYPAIMPRRVPSRYLTMWRVIYTINGRDPRLSEYVYAHDELGAIQAARKVWNQK